MLYENLNKYLEKRGLKTKADKNINKVDTIKAEFKSREKTKALTTSERLDRAEKLLGV